jgi:hypothetical protein
VDVAGLKRSPRERTASIALWSIIARTAAGVSEKNFNTFFDCNYVPQRNKAIPQTSCVTFS